MANVLGVKANFSIPEIFAMIFKCCSKAHHSLKNTQIIVKTKVWKGNFFIEEDSLHAGRSPPLVPPYILEKSVSANAALDTEETQMKAGF